MKERDGLVNYLEVGQYLNPSTECVPFFPGAGVFLVDGRRQTLCECLLSIMVVSFWIKANCRGINHQCLIFGNWWQKWVRMRRSDRCARQDSASTIFKYLLVTWRREEWGRCCLVTRSISRSMGMKTEAELIMTPLYQPWAAVLSTYMQTWVSDGMHGKNKWSCSRRAPNFKYLIIMYPCLFSNDTRQFIFCQKRQCTSKPLTCVVTEYSSHACTGHVCVANAGWGKGFQIKEVCGAALEACHKLQPYVEFVMDRYWEHDATPLRHGQQALHAGENALGHWDSEHNST